MSDTISRRDAFHVIDNCRFASEAEKKYAYSLMEQVESAKPDSYEQGLIQGRVEMRTEILSALKKMVGSEVWNSVE